MQLSLNKIINAIAAELNSIALASISEITRYELRSLIASHIDTARKDSKEIIDEIIQRLEEYGRISKMNDNTYSIDPKPTQISSIKSSGNSRDKILPQYIQLKQVVYFIIAGTNGPIKIGTARRDLVMKRLFYLQVGNHLDLRILRTIPGDFKIEKRLHDYFRSDHIRGEWFHYNKEMLTIGLKPDFDSSDQQLCLDLPSSIRAKATKYIKKKEPIHKIAELLFSWSEQLAHND